MRRMRRGSCPSVRCSRSGLDRTCSARLIDALNIAYDVKDTRPWWKQKLIAMASVVVIGFVILISDGADSRRREAHGLDR